MSDVEIEDDIEADVRAALTGDTQDPPEGVQAQPLAGDPLATDAPVEGQVRGPDGKFAKPPETVQTEPLAEAEAPIRPPASWSAQSKADFAALPPHIQKEVLKRETDVAKGFEERAQQLKRYEPLEAILAPRRDRLATMGISETTAIEQLFAAQDWLERDPDGALAHLVKSYGRDPAQFLGQPQAQTDPYSQIVQQHIQPLQQQIASFQQAAQQREQAELNSQITAFQADPANLYFENVRPTMARLIESGEATDLKEAYDKACWASPEIRPLLLSEQAKAEQAKLTQAARSKVANANGAAGSVSGSAAGVAQAPQTNNSIEDDVRAAFASLGGRA